MPNLRELQSRAWVGAAVRISPLLQSFTQSAPWKTRGAAAAVTANTCKEAVSPPAQLLWLLAAGRQRGAKHSLVADGTAHAMLPWGVSAQSTADANGQDGKQGESRGESKAQIPLMFFDLLSFYYQYWETYVNSTWYLWVFLINSRAESSHRTQENTVCFVSLHIN